MQEVVESDPQKGPDEVLIKWVAKNNLKRQADVKKSDQSTTITKVIKSKSLERGLASPKKEDY